MNISILHQPEEKISKLLSLIGQPARIQILCVIGVQEACVCHLEAALGTRQASISQHMMALRKAGLVFSRREGRNIFYRLVHPGVVEILQQAGQLSGIEPGALQALGLRPIPGCLCPQCNPALDPDQACRPDRAEKTGK
jgi:ArsR family transcriptional regulator